MPISFIGVIMTPVKVEECCVINIDASLTYTFCILSEIYIRRICKLR